MRLQVQNVDGNDIEAIALEMARAEAEEIPIPNPPFALGALITSQAEGDLQDLAPADRRVVRT